MKKNRLETLLLVFIKSELLSQIDYDDIIDEFKTMIPHDERLIL